jgi:CHASE2 domain-containing sensor protein
MPKAHPAWAQCSRQRLTLGLAISAALISGVLAWLSSATPLLQLLELKTYDLRFVLRGKQSPPGNIVVVAIDDRTDRAIPEPRIFWHPHYAVLLRSAAAGGVRAIALDISFAMSVDKWEPDIDRELAQRIGLQEWIQSRLTELMNKLGWNKLESGPRQ